MLAKWRAPLSRPWHSNSHLPRVLQTWTSHWLTKIFFWQMTPKAITNVWPLVLALSLVLPSLVILLWVITWWNMIWSTTWLGGNNKFVNFELFGSSMLGTFCFWGPCGKVGSSVGVGCKHVYNLTSCAVNIYTFSYSRNLTEAWFGLPWCHIYLTTYKRLSIIGGD